MLDSDQTVKNLVTCFIVLAVLGVPQKKTTESTFLSLYSPQG